MRVRLQGERGAGAACSGRAGRIVGAIGGKGPCAGFEWALISLFSDPPPRLLCPPPSPSLTALGPQSGDLALQRLQVRVAELEADLARRDRKLQERDAVINEERRRIEALREEQTATAAHVAHQEQTLQARWNEERALREKRERDLDAGACAGDPGHTGGWH